MNEWELSVGDWVEDVCFNPRRDCFKLREYRINEEVYQGIMSPIIDSVGERSYRLYALTGEVLEVEDFHQLVVERSFLIVDELTREESKRIIKCLKYQYRLQKQRDRQRVRFEAKQRAYQKATKQLSKEIRVEGKMVQFLLKELANQCIK